MNKKLEKYLKIVKPEEDHEFLNGRIVPQYEFEELEEELQLKIPSWIQAMLTTYKIAGLIFRFKTKTGKVKAIQFNDFGEISDNYYKLNPGSLIANFGYLCIADDPEGSGNPYFIKLDEGENPPIYQIEHDYSENPNQIIKNGTDKIADSLSDIFMNQVKRGRRGFS